MKTQGVVLTLAATEINRTNDFYRTVLGEDHVRLALGTVCLDLPGMMVFLAEVADFTRYSREAKRAPLLPVPATDALLSCAVASTEEIDATLLLVKEAGGKVFEAHQIPHVSGRMQYVGTFADPDGHLWQLVCNLSDAPGAA